MSDNTDVTQIGVLFMERLENYGDGIDRRGIRKREMIHNCGS